MFEACPLETAHWCAELAGGAIHHRGKAYSDLVPMVFGPMEGLPEKATSPIGEWKPVLRL